MRGRYKEIEVICQNKYIDLHIIPEFKKPKSRQKKYKPTKATQKIYNERRRAEEITQLINHNFRQDDIFLTITYDDKYYPDNEERAKKNATNFIRRLRRFYNKNNLPELKYMICTERGGDNQDGRLHHHVLLNGGDIPPKELNKLWGKGYITKLSPLSFNEHNGIEGIVHYFLKQPLSGNAYTCSRNLKQPERKERTGRLKRKDLEYMSRYGDVTPLLRLYPEREYQIVDYKIVYNDVNGYYYFAVKLVKHPLTKRKRAAVKSRTAKNNYNERIRL